MDQHRGTYIGDNGKLKGKSAIIRNINYHPGRLEAQFDDMSLPTHLTHGWRTFPISEFSIPGYVQLPTESIFAKPKQPKEYTPDTIAPELLTKRLRDW